MLGKETLFEWRQCSSSPFSLICDLPLLQRFHGHYLAWLLVDPYRAFSGAEYVQVWFQQNQLPDDDQQPLVWGQIYVLLYHPSSFPDATSIP